MLLDEEYDFAIDWWQLGVMTYQMLTRTSPFEGEDQDDVFDSILSNELAIPEDMTRESVNFVRGLMEKEPARRLGFGVNGAEQVMAHEFFDGVNWDDVYRKRIEAPFVPGLRVLWNGVTAAKLEMATGQEQGRLQTTIIQSAC